MKIESPEALKKWLEAELGYCNCSHGATLPLLREFLTIVRDRSDSTSDNEAFSRHSRALEALLPLDSAPGFADWFVYLLDQRGVVQHNFRLTDVWITEKGRVLLGALEAFEM